MRLADDLLALSREEAAEPPREAVRLDELARCRRRRTGRGRRARAGPRPRRRAALERALANLVENARRHGPADGEITVAARATPDGSRADRHATRARVSSRPRPSARSSASGAARANGTGSGLGLAIVRATAERHGGRAFVEGPRFTIDLPALTDLSESRATTEEESRKDRREAPSHTSDPRLLVLIVALLVLSAGGAALAVAASGAAAPRRRPSRSPRRSTTPLAAPAPDGVTARITFTNNLFPSGALLGAAGSPLMSGATGRLWVTDRRPRPARAAVRRRRHPDRLEPTRGDDLRRLLEHGLQARPCPRSKSGTTTGQGRAADASRRSASFLTKARRGRERLGRPAADVAGQPAYTVTRLAEARRRPARRRSSSPGTPRTACRCASAIYAQGASSPVLELARHRHLLRPGPRDRRRRRRRPRARRSSTSAPTPARAAPRATRATRRSPASTPSQAAAVPGRRARLARRAAAARTSASSAGSPRSSSTARASARSSCSSGRPTPAPPRAARSSALPTVSLDGVTAPRARDAARHRDRVRQRGGVDYVAGRLAPAGGRRGRGADAEVRAAPPGRGPRTVKRYGEIVAVDDVDLTVEAGDVFGYLGPNGAGKTTSLRMLLGLIRPTRGLGRALRPRPAGRRRAGARRRRRLRRGAALLPVPHAAAGTSSCSPPTTARRTRRAIDEVLELVDLADRAKDRVGGYSHGMQQRLGIAASLLRQPRLLLLDEPTTGLDPAGMRDMRDARPAPRRRGHHGRCSRATC